MSYPKLRGLIREKYGTQVAFAEAMEMHPTTLSFKLSGRSDWTRQEIEKACKLLDIPIEKVSFYFFNLFVAILQQGSGDMANIIRAKWPELTEEENARRMEQIKQAAAKLIIAAERSKK